MRTFPNIQDHRARRSQRPLSILLAVTVAVCSGTTTRADQGGSAAGTIANDRAATLESAASRLAADVEFLSSDALGGRGVGTPGIEEAADFIADRFGDIGLDTDLFNGTARQPVRVQAAIRIDPDQENSANLTLSSERDARDLELGRDFNPLSVGSSGRAAGPVLFAGYGITAHDRDYDDFAGFDLRGHIVMVIRKEPESWRRGARPSQYAYFSTKMANAAAHGAAGLIVVNDRSTLADQQEQRLAELIERVEAFPDVSGDQLRDPNTADAARRQVRLAAEQIRAADAAYEQNLDMPIGVQESGRAVSRVQVPAISITRSLANELLAAAGQPNLDQLEQQIADDGRPRTRLLEGVQFEFTTGLTDGNVDSYNVLGVLPGVGELADETVVVGAHYDHVGMGGFGSLAPGTIAVHNGADDNASGTAGLLEIARRLATDPPAGPRRRILFAAFTGEESGLIGSRKYVRSPRFPLESTVAMINLDMVGRLKANELTVFGTGTSPGFDALVEEHNQTAGFDLEKQETGNGPSDHQSFYDSQIPVLHFFTGLHNDYHRPGDDFGKINVTGLARITDMVSGIVAALATEQPAPTYLATSGSSVIRYQSRPYLGISTEDIETGVEVTRVVDGSPAESAGIVAGDVVTGIAETDVQTLADLRRVLSQHTPGDTVQVEINRDGSTQRLDVRLGSNR